MVERRCSRGDVHRQSGQRAPRPDSDQRRLGTGRVRGQRNGHARRHRRRGGDGPRALAADSRQGGHDRLRGAWHPGAAGAGRSAAASRYWTIRRRRSWPATEHGSRNISGRRRTSSGHGPVTSSSSCSPGPSPRCRNRRPTPRTRWPVPYPNGLYFRASIVEQLPDPLSPLFADLIDGSVSRSLRALMPRPWARTSSARTKSGCPPSTATPTTTTATRAMLRMMGQTPAAMRALVRGKAHMGVAGWREYSHPRYERVVEDWSAKPVGELSGEELLEGVQTLLDAGTVYYTAVQSIIPIAATSEISFRAYYDKFVRRDGDPPAADVPAGLRQRTHPGGEVAVRPRSLGPGRAGAGPGAPQRTDGGAGRARSAPASPPAGVDPALWRQWQAAVPRPPRPVRPCGLQPGLRPVRCRPTILARCWKR